MAQLTIAAVLLVLALGAAYQVGIAQSRSESSRLLHDLDLKQTENRRLLLLLAQAQQQAGHEEVSRIPPTDSPRSYSPELARITEIALAKLSEGVSSERLGRAMSLLDRDRVCQTEGEVKRATVGTSPIRDPGTISFPAGKISASLRGRAALDASGRPEAWFDPAQPIEMRFAASGQPAISISSTLPLEHRVVIDRREHILTVKPVNRRGQVELQLRVCEYP